MSLLKLPPHRVPTVENLGDEICCNGAVNVSTSVLKDKEHIGLYFAAATSEPCQEFTPHLARVYAAVKKKHKDFEVVFVSVDTNKAAFKKHFASMPWVAVPFEDCDRRVDLASKYKVTNLPTLVILDDLGNVLARNAIRAVARDQNATGITYPWKGADITTGSPWPLICTTVLFILFKLLWPYVQQYFAAPGRTGMTEEL